MTDDGPVPTRERRTDSRLPAHLAQAVLAALGTGVAIESGALGLWTRLGPGPGLLPLLLGVLLVVLAVIWAVQTLVAARPAGAAAEESEAVEPLDLPYIGVVIASLVVLGALLDLIGFQIAMALFLLLHLRWVGRRGWLLSVGLALVGSIGTFVLFDSVLQVPLPLSALPVLSDWGL